MKLASSLTLLKAATFGLVTSLNFLDNWIWFLIPKCSKSANKLSGSAPLNLPTALFGSAKITNSYHLVVLIIYAGPGLILQTHQHR